MLTRACVAEISEAERVEGGTSGFTCTSMLRERLPPLRSYHDQSIRVKETKVHNTKMCGHQGLFGDFLCSMPSAYTTTEDSYMRYR